jgi:phenylalanyl-tRNA synthetase beta chain
MKVSLNWLSDYVPVSMPAPELAALFLRIGFPVESIEETTSDIILDLEVTTNRPDLLGHVGVARELAAAAGLEFKPPAIGKLKTAGLASDLTRVEVLDPKLCPRYTARVIRNVKVGKSPQWLAERLEAVGLRAINNVVDVTNYVLLEYSQPLHAFDYDKLGEHRIVVRRAADGETMVSIDRTLCRLDSQMLVIADAHKPVAIAGIMGGLDSEVGEATTTVLLESAQFDPLTTRRTSRKLGILSESNYRFERGIDPVGLEEASRRACQLILQTAGGEVAEGVVDVWARPFEPLAVPLRPERTDALLGMHVPAERQEAVLKRLHLHPKSSGGKIVCTIPPWRADLSREVDLIEEVARLEGYEKVPVGTRVAHPVTPEALPLRTRKAAGEALRAAGFDEAVTISFIDAKEADLFGFPNAVRVDPLVRRTQNTLRPTVLPSLLRVLKLNQDAGNTDDVNLFELSQVFVPAEGSALPKEHLELGLVGTADLRAVRGIVEEVFNRISAQGTLALVRRPAQSPVLQNDPIIDTIENEPMVPGLDQNASAMISLNSEQVGVIGSVAPVVLSYYGLERPLTAATINLDALGRLAGAVRRFRPLPRFPAMVRDLSFIVDEVVIWEKDTESGIKRGIKSVIDAVKQPVRSAVEYVTTYRGKPIPAGRKSVTLRLTYRSEESTLRAEQVDELVQQIVAAMKKDLSAELRA